MPRIRLAVVLAVSMFFGAAHRWGPTDGEVLQNRSCALAVFRLMTSSNFLVDCYRRYWRQRIMSSYNVPFSY